MGDALSHRAHSMYVGVHLPGKKRHRRHKHHHKLPSTKGGPTENEVPMNLEERMSVTKYLDEMNIVYTLRLMFLILNMNYGEQ
uniref:Uncharacterized protein n=1 Tax=Rhodnius prolixus TaxID=13249 RepID=T1HZM9_RHOPR